MDGLLALLLLVVIFVILNRVILPKLGIQG